MIQVIKSKLKNLSRVLKKNPDCFLAKAKGVLHVGGNIGQERSLYNDYGLPVLWIEPIPEVFSDLVKNLSAYPKQSAIEALVTDADDQKHQFNVASNGGASSSILEMELHGEVWPDVSFERTIDLEGNSLPTVLKNHNIDPADFDTLIMDTQGSELLVLEGAIPLLSHFRFIKTEAANFESYKGCCQLSDIDNFMEKHGYKLISKTDFAQRDKGGSYFDVIYEKSR